jgi:hypothetical protein
MINIVLGLKQYSVLNNGSVVVTLDVATRVASWREIVTSFASENRSHSTQNCIPIRRISFPNHVNRIYISFSSNSRKRSSKSFFLAFVVYHRQDNDHRHLPKEQQNQEVLNQVFQYHERQQLYRLKDKILPLQ